MTEKKLMSREEFEAMRKESARAMSLDTGLTGRALAILNDADRYHWIHQTSWFGEPILNLPQDLFALQEIIYRTRPRYILEIGVAWGGSLLFYATLLQILGGDKVIGVDVYMPPDLRQRLSSHGPLSERLVLIEGSSLAEETFEQVMEVVGDCREVLVILDSHHSHDHVLAELRRYSPLVGKGQYLVCGDTVIEYLPADAHRPRPWGPGNSPFTAREVFLKEANRFVVDGEVDRKLLFTCNPGGYLRCVK
ncbi:MAG TPA: CmcI family methyltransferase [Syntrophales bacterium]|jgi:cephalosporin hydroxylase|nr:CmcI family methyltransferase [Syntrophales bacterium]HON23120.1 CmcI family methyltransferase [Syntrophales bacterium]HOU76710.1 CmcI family methyltransferase [Syntrophales bacterium]HPC31467.1 CmcI family methyltransferase [Syntrophales bacterium]HQG35489.1 CmcI family methyltransferase [Syntrophales bacterium]